MDGIVGKESKTKMLAKIAAMKEELARKKKKLRKSQRVAKIKAHVQQKLKEFNAEDEDHKHHFGTCENSGFCDDKCDKELSEPVPSNKKHSSTVCAFKQNGIDSRRVFAREIEEGTNILSNSPLNTHVINKNSLSCKEKCAEISERILKCDIESRIQRDPRILNSKHENLVSEMSLESFSPQGDFRCQSSYHLDNGEKFPSKEMKDNISSQLGLNEEGLHFGSQLISSVSKSETIKEFLNYSNNSGDHNISNSQFIEILGLSQPVTLTPIERSKQEQGNKGHKITLSLKHRREPTNQMVICDPLDADSQSTPTTICSHSGTKHLHTNVNGKSSFHADKDEDSKTNSTNANYEYTELDAISFSQFELTEDFLSENSCASQQESESNEARGKLKRLNYKPLIKRKSPRISAMSYSPDSLSSDVKGKRESLVSKSFYKTSTCKRSHLAEEKAAAVLSAFQFLIDEAKRQGGKDFQLPYTFKPFMEDYKRKWNLLKDERLRKESDEQNKFSEKTNDLFLLTEKVNCVVQNDGAQLSEYNKPNGSKEINTLKLNNEVSLYHSQNETSKHSSVFSQTRTEEKSVSDHHKPHFQSQNFESEAKCVESQVKCVDNHYESYSQPQETVRQANFLNGISQSHSSQCNEKNAADFSQPNDVENSSEEANNSFCIPSSMGLGTPISHTSDPVKVKSVKMAGKETTVSEKSNASDHSFLCSQDVRDTDVLNSNDRKCSTFNVDNNNTTSINSLLPLQKEASQQSKSISSFHQKNSHYQERIRSPHTNEICKMSLSCHKPRSSSTPISDVKVRSRFKSSSQRVISRQLSDNTDYLTCIIEELDPPTALVTTTIKDTKVLNAVELDDTLQSAQNVVNVDVSICSKGEGERTCTSPSPLLASPISKWSEGHFSPMQILPWKKIPRTPYTPLRILEGENNASSCRNLFSPTFIYGDLNKRDTLPRPIKHEVDLKGKGAALYFAGCFQSCSEDSVVQLLHCEVKTEGNEMKAYLVSVQASALTIWAQDVDGKGWIAELDWRLSSDTHILEACSLAGVSNKIAIAAYGWEENQLFATVFVYDVCSDITNRFNLPIVEGNVIFKNLDKLHFCCMSPCHLLMGICSAAFHTIRSVVFDENIHSVASSRLLDPCRGALIELQSCADLPKACFGLTSDQRIVIWNIEIGAVLKSIQMPSAFPCLTSLFAVTSVKGFLLLTVSWRIKKSDCGGIILLNPVTEQVLKHCVYKIPNSGWKHLQNVQLLKDCVVAVSSSGSVSWWNHLTGALLGHRKSHSATCATVIGAKSVLIGEVQGCVHIYSTPAS